MLIEEEVGKGRYSFIQQIFIECLPFTRAWGIAVIKTEMPVGWVLT